MIQKRLQVSFQPLRFGAHCHQNLVVPPHEQHPQHRLGRIPFIGKKVDTIDWARGEIRTCSELLEKGRAVIESGVSGTGVQVRACTQGVVLV